MSWILWGGSSEEPPSPEHGNRELHKKSSPLPTEFSFSDILDRDADDMVDDDDELEWDSWPEDLARQARSGLDTHIAVTVPELSPAHALHVRGGFGISRNPVLREYGPPFRRFPSAPHGSGRAAAPELRSDDEHS